MVDNSIGRFGTEFFNPMLYEARKTFKDNSYEELQRAYNFSEKEIKQYTSKYISDTKNINLAVTIAITLIPATKFGLSLGSIGDIINKTLANEGIKFTTEQITGYLIKAGFVKVTSGFNQEAKIGRSDLIKMTTEDLKKIQNIEIKELNKERMYIAIAGRENERYREAAKLADKDEEFLRPITTKNLSTVLPEDIRNMCKGNNICIDEEKFKKKYPSGDIKIAKERLSRYLNFTDNYININQIARTNYYLESFTKKTHPYSNSRQSQNNGYRR
ncbi:MAG: hypothetical protein Q4D53_01865 [Leptotrichiaceae bacterium]|nr:hypothetical protein [Leptotrichiaceae bacterium]